MGTVHIFCLTVRLKCCEHRKCVAGLSTAVFLFKSHSKSMNVRYIVKPSCDGSTMNLFDVWRRCSELDETPKAFWIHRITSPHKPGECVYTFAYYFFGVNAYVSNIDVYRLAGRKSVSGTSWCSADERGGEARDFTMGLPVRFNLT